MKKMLINATQPEELRTALVDGQLLYDFNTESENYKQRKSNIYKGQVVQVSVSLEAAFVSYGAERHGFLPFREIAPELLDGASAPRIGQEFIVQVDKEERGTKGASLTTYPSIPGRFLVLMPNNPRIGGVSRLIDKEEERRQALDLLAQLNMPQGMGLIVRTAGLGRSQQELQHDLDYLMELWQSILHAGQSNSAPMLIYEDSDPVVRILRDYMRNDITEVLIDDEDFYRRAQDFIRKLLPGEENRIRLYSEPDPLFVRYQVESQIETAYSRDVSLPSGGQMVFDNTEALLSIDINSARNTGGSDIEATALHTNMEAAAEIPRQLRLRDTGGLIVIDFIDMSSNSNQRKVEECLREHTRVDRARIQIGRISRFGLMEMSRQRLRPSLSDAHLQPCSRCRGIGHLRTVSSQANAILRLIEEESFKDVTAKVLVRLPVDVASVLINDKKEAIQAIEKHTGVKIMIFPSKNLDHPDYQIRRIKNTDSEVDSGMEQEFNEGEPLAGNDEAFLRHAQAQGAQAKELSSRAAVKYGDIQKPYKPERQKEGGNTTAAASVAPESKSTKRGLFSLFGLLNSRKEVISGDGAAESGSEVDTHRHRLGVSPAGRTSRSARMQDENNNDARHSRRRRGGRRGRRTSNDNQHYKKARDNRGNNNENSDAANAALDDNNFPYHNRDNRDSRDNRGNRSYSRRRSGYRHNVGNRSAGGRGNDNKYDSKDSNNIRDDIGNRR